MPVWDPISVRLRLRCDHPSSVVALVSHQRWLLLNEELIPPAVPEETLEPWGS